MKLVKRFVTTLALVGIVSGLAGCASVDMKATPQEAAEAKQFIVPTDGTANVYVYRDSMFGAALGKSVYLDGKYLGQTGPKSFYRTNVEKGIHVLSTESEFSENHLLFTADPNTNRYFRQYIKMGVFVGGANVVEVMPVNAERAIRSLDMAKTQNDPSKDLPLTKEELIKAAEEQ